MLLFDSYGELKDLKHKTIEEINISDLENYAQSNDLLIQRTPRNIILFREEKDVTGEFSLGDTSEQKTYKAGVCLLYNYDLEVCDVRYILKTPEGIDEIGKDINMLPNHHKFWKDVYETLSDNYEISKKDTFALDKNRYIVDILCRAPENNDIYKVYTELKACPDFSKLRYKENRIIGDYKNTFVSIYVSKGSKDDGNIYLYLNGFKKEYQRVIEFEKQKPQGVATWLDIASRGFNTQKYGEDDRFWACVIDGKLEEKENDLERE